jgi:hypothetical protein
MTRRQAEDQLSSMNGWKVRLHDECQPMQPNSKVRTTVTGQDQRELGTN